MPTATKKFFEIQTEASAVKTRITTSYFASWATLALKKTAGEIAYLDMFCGPGRYDNGPASTPLIILEMALAQPALTRRLVTIFNDQKKKYIRKLEDEIANFPNIDQLTYKPVTMNETIGPETERYFLENSTVPALTFIDPFGYTSLTLNLIKGVTKNFFCECIFFFSYAGINRALGIRGTFTERMESIFGTKRAAQLEAELNDIGSSRRRPSLREEMIIDSLTKALEEVHNGYVRWFRFIKRRRTSHMLVFVSKNALGYRIMNEVMGNAGFRDEIGIPHYTHYDSPPPVQNLFYPEFNALKEALLSTYAGKVRTRQQIYEEHSVRRNYIAANYKAALLELEAESYVVAAKSPAKRQRDGKTTLGPDMPLTFRTR